MNIDFLGSRTVVAHADGLAHLIEELGFRRGRRRNDRCAARECISVQWVNLGDFYVVSSRSRRRSRFKEKCFHANRTGNLFRTSPKAWLPVPPHKSPFKSLFRCQFFDYIVHTQFLSLSGVRTFEHTAVKPLPEPSDTMSLGNHVERVTPQLQDHRSTCPGFNSKPGPFFISDGRCAGLCPLP
jgi:hypothetical protein